AGADYTDKVLRDKSYRLYKEGDLVPLLGLTIIGFKHTGKALHFKSESKINPIKNHSIKEIKKDIVLGKAVHKNQKNPTEEMHKNIIDILKELFNNIKNAITKLFN
ncbi:MAG: hypothetical protein FWC41_13020, partial [Firmicutes bacterium]|nr:hypothetical protein [Bacillota bacterium]